ncbi:MAG: hypothetical protein A3A97_01975 [Candidatus Terrybacteria bacterium RIFCSPLOWO2_01_FULL_40_23]|uniref:Thioredoxin-like fold domain-containing protein n=1 Tax=Candidatus Terrybacteria bacterium RIFCSPLOWO2_01_FULL_40_23 TaxID=1802366 RepID=A0A1G2PSE1_9BACT|nr:MAG: hypothetical protein A3A97_01975 [Candidatus Terrybacteria bacterium RIFCSPLOWO2_01_FULL_40_23]
MANATRLPLEVDMLGMIFNKKTPKIGSLRELKILIFGGIISIVIAGSVLAYKPQATYRQNSTSSYESFLTSVADMPFLGKAEAPITVIEFADPLCPGAKSFFDIVESGLKTKYIETGLIRFYQWPTVINKVNTSINALEAMHCADDQDKYWQYRDYLLTIRPREDFWAVFTLDDYKQFAQVLNLDTDKFNACFDGGKYEKWIREIDSQRERAGINSSPTLLVNNQILSFTAFDELDAAIEREIIKENGL